MLTRIVACTLVVLAFAVPEAARAQSALDDRARVHFESGRAYFDTGDYESAIREFISAYELSHRFGLLLNISTTYERLGDLPNAITYLERYIQEGAATEDMSTHRLRLERMRARAAAGLPAEPEGGPAPAGGGGGDDLLVPALVSYGIGVAGFALTLGFGLAAVEEDNNLAVTCGVSCSDEQVSTLFTYTIAADVGLAVGVAGAVIGTVLLIVGAAGGSGESPTAAVLPYLTPDGVGIAAGGVL